MLREQAVLRQCDINAYANMDRRLSRAGADGGEPCANSFCLHACVFYLKYGAGGMLRGDCVGGGSSE